MADQAEAEASGESKAGKTRLAEIRDMLYPERMIETGGENVRLTIRTSGSVVGTMVNSGYFPISPTGFRSLVPGTWSARRRLNGQMPSASQMLEMGARAADGLSEEKSEKAENAIRRSKKSPQKTDGIDSEERPIVALVRATSPSIGKIADVALTSSPKKRDEMIKAGIRQYEKAVRLEGPNYEPIRAHRNWTVEGYDKTIQGAKESLEKLNAAQPGGLFTGSQDLKPLLQEASSSVRWAYAQSGYIQWETVGPTRPRYESEVRAKLRQDLSTNLLTEETLDQLAQRMVEVEERIERTF